MITNTKDLEFGQEVYFAIKEYMKRPPATQHSEGVRRTLIKISIMQGKVESLTATHVGIRYNYALNTPSFTNVSVDCVTTDPKECIDLIYQLGKTIITKE